MSTELVQVLQEFSLAEEKKNVVNGLLQPFFAKAEEWKTQVESIVITDPTQTDKMALAKTGRLQLKNFRLEAEKLIKAQREIVKTRMADDVLEDKLWLRSGQIMEAVFKNLETKLEEKEKFAERWEAEQIEKRRVERSALLAEYNQVEIPGLGQMLQDQFEMYLGGVKAKHEQDEIARKEAEEKQRKDTLHNTRKYILSRYADFITEFDKHYFGEITEEDFIKLGVEAKAKKDAYDAEQARIKAENERLQKEAEEKQRLAEAEKKRIQDEADAKAEKLRKENEAKEAQLKAEADAKLKAEQEAKAKAESEAQALRQAELDRQQAEKQKEADRLAEQEAIAQQGEKQRILTWIESFELPAIPGGGYTAKGQARVQEINAKFEAFKNWAKSTK
jgi:hypothetical protein